MKQSNPLPLMFLSTLALFAVGCDDSRAEPSTAPAAQAEPASKPPPKVAAAPEPVAEGKTLTQLLTMLEAADKLDRMNAAVALNKIQPRDENDKVRIITALRTSLKDKETSVVSFAAAGLVRLGQDGVLELVRAIEDDSKNEIDAIAVTQLAKAGKDAVDPLIGMLEHAQQEKAILASSTLSRIGKPAVPALIAATRPAMGDRPNQKRLLAVAALGDMGPVAKDAIPAIQDRLNDREPGIREIAAQALKSVQGR